MLGARFGRASSPGVHSPQGEGVAHFVLSALDRFLSSTRSLGGFSPWNNWHRQAIGFTNPVNEWNDDVSSTIGTVSDRRSTVQNRRILCAPRTERSARGWPPRSI